MRVAPLKMLTESAEATPITDAPESPVPSGSVVADPTADGPVTMPWRGRGEGDAGVAAGRDRQFGDAPGLAGAAGEHPQRAVGLGRGTGSDDTGAGSVA